jgi:enamine deaminase RidA (YjgF/YER057c/UK114 family)
MKILQPKDWSRPKGFSYGIAASGRSVFVSGMIGSGPDGKIVSSKFTTQLRQALQNIVAVLAEAGAKPEHIVRMTWYLLDKKEYVAAYKEIGAIYREIIGGHYPAMTAVQVAALVDDAARVEIEVTAVIPE